ncbi:hypothetical protein D3C80_1950570 [compost metagenome]
MTNLEHGTGGGLLNEAFPQVAFESPLVIVSNQGRDTYGSIELDQLAVLNRSWSTYRICVVYFPAGETGEV